MYSLFGLLHMEWMTHRLHTKATDNNTMDASSQTWYGKNLTSKQETLRTERSTGKNSRLGNN